MVAVSDAIRILLTADGTQAISEFKKVGAAADTNLKKAEAGSKNLGQTLTKVGVGATVAGVAIGAGLFKAAEAASTADLAQRKLSNTIGNSKELVGASTAAFNKQADALEKTTVYSHVATTTIQALLGQYKLTQAQILTATPLVEDFASKFGIDTVAAAKAVGKAFEGTGVGLARYGIITGVTKKGTDNFNLTISALRRTVAGFANSEGKTFSGQIAIIKNELKHTEEQIGAGAIPVFKSLGSIVGGVTGGFVHLDDATGGAIGKFAAYGSAALIAGGGLAFIAGQAKNAAVAMKLISVEGGLTPFGQVALAAAALGLAYEGISHDGATAVSPVEDLSNAIKASGLDAQAATKDIQAYLGANSPFPRLMQASGVSVDQFTQAIEKGGAAYALLDLKLRGGNVAQQLLAAELEAQRKKFVETSAAAKAYAEQQSASAQITAQAQVKINHHIQDGRESYLGYSQAAKDAAKGTQGVGDAASAAAGQVLSLNGAMLKLLGTSDTAAGAQRKAAEDYLAVGDATSTLTADQLAAADAVKKYGANSQQAQDANRKASEDFLQLGDSVQTAKQSYIDAAAASAGYVIGGKNSTRANNDFIYSLQQMAAQTTGPVHAGLEDLLSQLHKIPAHKGVKVTADTSQANATLTAFENQWLTSFNMTFGLALSGSQFFGASSSGGQGSGAHGHRAGGGPVEANKRYVVGEQGPELFVPRMSGTIVPHGKMRETGGSTVVNQTIYITNPDPKAVVDALNRAALNGVRPNQKVLVG